MLGEVSARVLGVLALGLLSACATGANATGGGPAPVRDGAGVPKEQPIPADLQAAVKRSIDIGAQLYVLDQVASLGTDVLLAHVPHPETKKVAGYLPFREGDDAGRPTNAFQVSFFTSDQPPRIAYTIHLEPKTKPRFEALEPPITPPDGFVALVRARQTALAALAALPHPAQPLNPVVVPAEAYGESGVLVYLLAGTKKPKVAVFGKHYRALVPMGGTQVTYLKELSKSALEVPTEYEGQTPSALTVTHLVTEFPLETHVFTSLLTRLPIYVRTSRGTWRVNGEEIAFLGAGS